MSRFTASKHLTFTASPLPPAGSSSSSRTSAYSPVASSMRRILDPTIAERAAARNARPRPWLQSTSPARVERPARVSASTGTRTTHGPYLSSRRTAQADIPGNRTIKSQVLSPRPRTGPYLTSRRQQADILATKVLPSTFSQATASSSARSCQITQHSDDIWLDLVASESIVHSKPSRALDKLADHKARYAAFKAETSARARQLAQAKPTRRTTSSVDVVPSAPSSRPRAISTCSTASTASSNASNKRFSPVPWQPILSSSRQQAPLPKTKKQVRFAPSPLPPRQQSLPKIKAKKQVRFDTAAPTVKIVSRWINKRDLATDLEAGVDGALRRFSNRNYLMGDQFKNTVTHPDCGCTMEMLQVSPERRLPSFAPELLHQFRGLKFNARSAGTLLSSTCFGTLPELGLASDDHHHCISATAATLSLPQHSQPGFGGKLPGDQDQDQDQDQDHSKFAGKMGFWLVESFLLLDGLSTSTPTARIRIRDRSLLGGWAFGWWRALSYWVDFQLRLRLATWSKYGLPCGSKHFRDSNSTCNLEQIRPSVQLEASQRQVCYLADSTTTITDTLTAVRSSAWIISLEEIRPSVQLEASQRQHLADITRHDTTRLDTTRQRLETTQRM
ncbi:hypothetical protein MMC13_006195 [Lambiella insularis]|nr:hypothetical protein [Lambiella insularis]